MHCIELDKLYQMAYRQFLMTGNGLHTLWLPENTEEYKAISEHKNWNNKFKKHQSICIVCKDLIDEDKI